jgi:hypothetical protein
MCTSATAQGARGIRVRSFCPDGAWLRVSVLSPNRLRVSEPLRLKEDPTSHATGDTGVVVRGGAAARHSGSRARDLGWMFGSPWAGLACARIMHLAWQLVNLFRLEWWLRHRSYADDPDAAACGARSLRRSCGCIAASASTNSASFSSCVSCSAPPPRCPNGVVILNGAARDHLVQPHGRTTPQPAPDSNDLGLRIENLLREPEFSALSGGAGYSNPVVIRPTTGVETATCRCRSFLTATASSFCW